MSLIGGTNLSDTLHRVFWKVMDPKLAKRFTLAGRTQVKRAFRKTNVADIVMAATRLSGVTGSDRDMEHIIADILKHAGDAVTQRKHTSRDLRE